MGEEGREDQEVELQCIGQAESTNYAALLMNNQSLAQPPLHFCLISSKNQNKR